MRVLVTGHRGYIGVELIPLLRAAGYDEVGLDNGYFDACDFGAPPTRSRRSVAEVVPGCEVTFAPGAFADQRD